MNTVKSEVLKVEEAENFEQSHKVAKGEGVEAPTELAEGKQTEKYLEPDHDQKIAPTNSSNHPTSGNEIWYDAVEDLDDDNLNFNELGLPDQQPELRSVPGSTLSEDLVDEDIPWSMF
jgi:hypothetical protein